MYPLELTEILLLTGQMIKDRLGEADLEETPTDAQQEYVMIMRPGRATQRKPSEAGLVRRTASEIDARSKITMWEGIRRTPPPQQRAGPRPPRTLASFLVLLLTR